MVAVVYRVALECEVNGDEIKGLLSVVKDYEFALELLDQYDHETVLLGCVSDREVNIVNIHEVYDIIRTMSTDFSTDLFGKERDQLLPKKKQYIL